MYKKHTLNKLNQIHKILSPVMDVKTPITWVLLNLNPKFQDLLVENKQDNSYKLTLSQEQMAELYASAQRVGYSEELPNLASSTNYRMYDQNYLFFISIKPYVLADLHDITKTRDGQYILELQVNIEIYGSLSTQDYWGWFRKKCDSIFDLRNLTPEQYADFAFDVTMNEISELKKKHESELEDLNSKIEDLWDAIRTLNESLNYIDTEAH